ncbi:MAG: protein-L-isoaspartate(D-aspartate) O-methyltransferase [Deltaproteobacteria bacterium]|nr:protein-L-isoaspartate(D-aspartate) O-methyltransferase [Candidatus Anaeroferrophillacea bacterium]
MDKDYDKRRELMVERQLIGRGISDVRVLTAMGRVKRHRFVPAELARAAYDDRPLPIGNGQTISQPYMVAAMTELLALVNGREKVLEIGTGSGYQAAILAELAGEVVTIEREEPLAAAARRRLAEMGYTNIRVIGADGTRGYPPAAPYDGIIVTAGAPHVPAALTAQLAENGRLVIPVGPRSSQTLTLVKKVEGRLITSSAFRCVFVPLRGVDGWPENGGPY